MPEGKITISKESLAQLKAARFPGEIVVIDTPDKLADALKELTEIPVVGFDTETKPTFRKGNQNKVALVQISTESKAFLIRINKLGFRRELIDFLQDSRILKIGLSIKDDFHNLNKLAACEPVNFIDLQSFVKDYKIADNSLSRIYAILFDKRICKGQRLSNWEAEILTTPQLDYAALDAYACLEIYRYLTEGNFNPLTSPYYTIEIPENLNPDSKTSENQPDT